MSDSELKEPALPSVPGYKFWHNGALVFLDPSARVHATTKLWHFAKILAGVQVAQHCVIGGGVELGRGTTVGAGTHIGSGVFLPPKSRIGRGVFIGPNVTCCDDKLPRVLNPGDPPYKAEPPVIEDDAVIGAHAVLLPGIRIGKGARVAAGALVTKSVPDHAMVRNPQAAKFRTMPEAWEHARSIPA